MESEDSRGRRVVPCPPLVMWLVNLILLVQIIRKILALRNKRVIISRYFLGHVIRRASTARFDCTCFILE